MFCPNCNGVAISVKDTLQTEMETHRVKQCKDCGFRFYTTESVRPADEIQPLFSQWSKERVRKLRAKEKGVEYEPQFKSETSSTPKKPTSPLF